MSGRILVLEDDESLRLVITKALSRAGFEVRATASPDTALERMAAREADALVADVLLGRENFLDRLGELARLRPDAPVVIMSAQTTAATAISAGKSGVFEYLPKPFDLNDLVDILNRALNVAPAIRGLRTEVYGDLVGRSAAMQETFRALGRLAGSSDPVLIIGPEGSGRAAAGRVLHRDGGAKGRLVEVGPLELEDRGRTILAEAAGGTALLRRAQAWSPRAQALVQEALEVQSGQGARIVATASLEVQDHLAPAILDRLAVGLVQVPALRERGDDRALLFRRFLEEAAGRGASLSEEAAAFVNAQVWDGEVAQLRRTARRIAGQGPRGPVGAQAVRDAMKGPGGADANSLLQDSAARYFAQRAAAGDRALADGAQAALESGLITAALEASGGVRQEAARLLGMNRNTFTRKLEALLASGRMRPDSNRR